MGLVHHLARELAQRMGSQTSLADLVSAGTVGLLEALQSFDESKGFAFSTFAVPRIRGAMYDELRHQDGLPRSFHRKQRQIEAARREFIREHKRAPEESELAVVLGIDLETFARWRSEVEGFRPVPLDHLPAGYVGAGHDPSLAAAMVGSDSSQIEERLNRDEEVVHLRDALLCLKERERLVLTLHYFEGLKFCEIAEALEVSGARISQIHAEAVDKLQRKMRRLRAA